MSNKDKTVPARSQRLAIAKLTPPDWFGWLGVLAMFLLAGVRVKLSGGVWYFPLLSLGEWLLLPLGVASLSMGFLSLSRIREKTLLPLWLSAITPALLWLAATALAMANSGVDANGGDLFLSWAVHLIFPTLTFLPLLTMRVWRNRLMWALAGGMTVNAVAVFLQAREAGIAPPDTAMLAFGGFLANQHDYAMMIGLALPILAAWRGGERGPNKALSTLFCTFLLPVLCLAACQTWVGMLAAGIGLVVSWAAWRSHAWILGIFVCLLVFGYGSATKEKQDAAQRKLLADSAMMGNDCYRRAFNTFQVRPLLGSGPDAFCDLADRRTDDITRATPWFASLLGGSGLVGLGMWLVLLGELAARTMGRFGRRCLWHGGVLGGVSALTVAGLWTDALPEGAGALVGLLIALSILEEPDEAPPPRRQPKPKKDAEAPAAPPPAPAPKSGDTDVIVKR